MQVQSEDIIANWSNSLRQTRSGERMIVAQVAEGYKSRGFNSTEATQMLDAQRFDTSLVDDVVAETYGLSREADSTPVRTREAMLCPNSYREVIAFIDESLENLSPKQFVNKLALSDDPILKISEKSLASWYRLAEAAKSDQHARGMLHKDLKPWVEEAIYLCVLAARKMDGKFKGASANSTRMSYATKKFVEAEVDLNAGTCTCDKFNKGNFKDFGLACEHLIKAADTVSPLQRLKRAISL